MALSNIIVEPRREITEQLAGLVVMGIPFWVIYHVACWFHTDAKGADPFALDLFIAALLVAFASLIISGILFLMHAMGEWACGALRDRGLEIRPQQRYRRDYDGKIVKSR